MTMSNSTACIHASQLQRNLLALGGARRIPAPAGLVAIELVDVPHMKEPATGSATSEREAFMNAWCCAGMCGTLPADVEVCTVRPADTCERCGLALGQHPSASQRPELRVRCDGTLARLDNGLRR